MKIAILGATGWIGSHIANEAASRGHEIIAIVRDTSKVAHKEFEVRVFDLLDPQAKINDVASDADAVIASIGGRTQGNHELVKQSAEKLLSELPSSQRLMWVGGAGSLEVAPNVALFTVPDFPEEYKAESLAQIEALEVFKKSGSDVKWTFASPAAEIFPGATTFQYRIGGNQLLTDSEGNSRISVSDYAIAMIDILESGEYINQQIGLAY